MIHLFGQIVYFLGKHIWVGQQVWNFQQMMLSIFIFLESLQRLLDFWLQGKARGSRPRIIILLYLLLGEDTVNCKHI